jgi:hypothetical protein
MKKLFDMATTGTLLLSGIALAQKFPVYELSGFPISPHQISVMGATVDLKEQSSGISLTMGGMSASPVQILVLTPRRRIPSPAHSAAGARNPSPEGNGG